jgi:hypothetical protein
MPGAQQGEQCEDMEKHSRETLNALIREQVIHNLGKPDALHGVQVRRLWKHYYRVNVYVGADATSAKIANSYFVHADGDGNIVAASPKITKQYEPGAGKT